MIKNDFKLNPKRKKFEYFERKKAGICSAIYSVWHGKRRSHSIDTNFLPFPPKRNSGTTNTDMWQKRWKDSNHAQGNFDVFAALKLQKNEYQWSSILKKTLTRDLGSIQISFLLVNIFFFFIFSRNDIVQRLQPCEGGKTMAVETASSW